MQTMFGGIGDVDDAEMFEIARALARAMLRPGLLTKLRLDIQGLLSPLAIARSSRCVLWLLDISLN